MPFTIFTEKWPRLQLLQIAKVEDLAAAESIDNIEDHDKAILDRIRKCNERARHENTSEGEKKAAMLLASRLMKTHNIQQIDLINAAAADAKTTPITGHSTVGVYANKPGAKYRHETWAVDAAEACTIFFDCEFYTTRRPSRLQWTFYGIARNTSQAATSFEMIYNSIQEWSAKRRRKVKLHDYRMGIAQELVACAEREREEEIEVVRKKEADSLAAQETEEAIQRQKLLERLSYQPPEHGAADISLDGKEAPQCKLQPESEYKPPAVQDDEHSKDADGDTIVVNVPYKTSDDSNIPEYNIKKEEDDEGYLSDTPSSVPSSWNGFDEDDSAQPEHTQDADLEVSDSEDDELAAREPFDASADFEDEIRRHLPKEKSREPAVIEPTTNSVDKENVPADLTTFNNMSALTLYYKNTKKIADDYLKKNKVKLLTGRKREYDIKDHDSYEAGRRDGKKIDAKRRRIEDVPDEDRPEIKENIEIVVVEDDWVLVNFLA